MPPPFLADKFQPQHHAVGFSFTHKTRFSYSPCAKSDSLLVLVILVVGLNLFSLIYSLLTSSLLYGIQYHSEELYFIHSHLTLGGHSNDNEVF